MQPFSLWTALVIVATYVTMLALELWRPLRRERENKLRRIARNFTLGGLALAVTTLLQAPLLTPWMKLIAERRIGLLGHLELPSWIELALAILLLDYTLWFWHWANHRVPFLWRFHLVHHVDRDLDASTAVRFHFGELVLSIGFRALQIGLIGATPSALWSWQVLLFASILFHHSNARLPLALERVLVRVVVTPRMHGIHHSAVENETNSNWSSLLSVWDRLHRTILLDVPQARITIGVSAFQAGEDVALAAILAEPFRSQRQAWIDVNGREHRTRGMEPPSTWLAP